MDACNVHGVYLKSTYLWEHAVLFPLSGCTPELCTWWTYSRLGAGPYGICVCCTYKHIYKVSLYVCLSGVMCGDVLQAPIVITLSCLLLCLD